MDGTRFIYKSCGALPALVQERADRLAALALLMGRSGTAVCVCVRVLVCVCVCVCVCWRGWELLRVAAAELGLLLCKLFKRHRGVRCPRVPGADTTAFLLFSEGNWH